MPARYHLWISGCQMNSSDARRLADGLDRAGMTPSDRFEDADAAILYTCSVRQSAENRVHGQLGHLKSLKARRPGMVLCVTGCMAGGDRDELRRRYPWVDHFVAPAEMDDLPRVILSDVEEGRSCLPAEADYTLAVPVSAGVTVIRGCDKYCSYCIVPYRRGRQQSRPAADVLREAESLLARGAREIVLLGQTVDAWGRELESPATLASLLKQVAALPGIERVRFLTSHPKDFTPDIMEAMAETPQLCEEVNLPIQAGDDEVLRGMARPYTVAQYLGLVDSIRAMVPDVALATDLIVGFSGETETQFDHSMELLRRVEFDTVHVAAYSPRPGTAAARKMADDVPAEEKSRRLQRVEALQTELSARKNGRMVGQTVDVLVEGRTKGRWSGRTRTNKLVFFESDEEMAGRLAAVLVESAGAWSLRGRLQG